jgi:hypothetical protein
LQAAAEFFREVLIFWIPKLQTEMNVNDITILIVTTVVFLWEDDLRCFPLCWSAFSVLVFPHRHFLMLWRKQYIFQLLTTVSNYRPITILMPFLKHFNLLHITKYPPFIGPSLIFFSMVKKMDIYCYKFGCLFCCCYFHCVSSKKNWFYFDLASAFELVLYSLLFVKCGLWLVK